MLIAGAVCPHPPLLIPAALGAAAAEPPPELRKLATAAAAAVAGLLAADPDLIAVVGGGEADQEYGPDAAGTLRGYGVDVTVGTGEPVLPLPLTVGRWLLGQAGVAGLGRDGAPGGAARPAVLFQAVDQRATPSVCRKLGMIVAQRAGRVAVLAMGDASARRAREAPEVPDPAAEDYDDDVAEALAAADTRWLCRLDPALDRQLVVAGRAAWQVLAGAAEGRRLDGRLLCMTSPYGVTYLVAAWAQQPLRG
ncbi:MAG TPA: hypothetical protein VH641_21440 [Streptosporangiaceae bacterium]|jgi:hypothetical protein